MIAIMMAIKIAIKIIYNNI